MYSAYIQDGIGCFLKGNMTKADLFPVMEYKIWESLLILFHTVQKWMTTNGCLKFLRNGRVVCKMIFFDVENIWNVVNAKWLVWSLKESHRRLLMRSDGSSGKSGALNCWFLQSMRAPGLSVLSPSPWWEDTCSMGRAITMGWCGIRFSYHSPWPHCYMIECES